MSFSLDRRHAIAALALMAVAARAAGMRPRPKSSSSAIAAQLAPSGRLRVAINVGNVVLAQRTARGASGPSVDIANEIGRRLHLQVDLIVYDAAGAVVSALDRDRWDMAFMGVDPARANAIGFTAPYLYIEGTYMVRSDSSFQRADDLDRDGVRIAVGRGAAYDLYLSRALKHASLVRFQTSNDAIRKFASDRLEAVAGVRQALVEAQGAMPGYRVLADSFNRIEQAIAIPKGRDIALSYVADTLEGLKANGFVRAALDRAGQEDAILAPPARFR